MLKLIILSAMALCIYEGYLTLKREISSLKSEITHLVQALEVEGYNIKRIEEKVDKINGR